MAARRAPGDARMQQTRQREAAERRRPSAAEKRPAVDARLKVGESKAMHLNVLRGIGFN